MAPGVAFFCCCQRSKKFTAYFFLAFVVSDRDNERAVGVLDIDGNRDYSFEGTQLVFSWSATFGRCAPTGSIQHLRFHVRESFTIFG